MGELEVSVKTPSNPLNFVLKKNVTGQQLVTKVAGLLGLREVRFFGLQFVDYKGTTTWLGSSETLDTQRVRKESPLHLEFMVRFWPRDVTSEVAQETTRVLFFRQLQAAVDSGELCCPSSTAAQLGGYAAQVRYGDFADDHCGQTSYRDSVVPPGTTSSNASLFGLQPEAQAAWKLKVANLHRSHRGLSQSDALKEYFKLAQELPTYGVTYFEVSSKSGDALWLGVTASGINWYEDKLTPKMTFSWSSISNIAYSGRKIFIKLNKKDKKLLYASREQVCLNIMLQTKGYHQLNLQRRTNLEATTDNYQGTSPLRTARLSSSDAGRNTSGDSGTSVPGNRDRNPSRGSSEAGAVGGSDELDIQDVTGAVAQSWNATASPLRGTGDNSEDSSRPVRGTEDDFEDSLRPLRGSEAGRQSRKSRWEPSLLLSASKHWGSFVQSLMAPD